MHQEITHLVLYLSIVLFVMCIQKIFHCYVISEGLVHPSTSLDLNANYKIGTYVDP